MIEKSPEAFRTISEVAEELDVPQHVLRFWETRFSQIKPMKRGGGRRYYRPEDVNLLKGIRFLLYGEGYTIKGVQRILKEQGVRHVAVIWEEVLGAEEAEEADAAFEDLPEPEPEAPPRRPVIAQPMAPPRPAVPPVQRPVPMAAPVAAAPVAAAPVVAASHAHLSQDDVRQLKAALFELIECKRLLDAAR